MILSIKPYRIMKQKSQRQTKKATENQTEEDLRARIEKQLSELTPEQIKNLLHEITALSALYREIMEEKNQSIQAIDAQDLSPNGGKRKIFSESRTNPRGQFKLQIDRSGRSDFSVTS